MNEFKVGDWVECINFEGATGQFFSRKLKYQIKTIGSLEITGKMNIMVL